MDFIGNLCYYEVRNLSIRIYQKMEGLPQMIEQLKQEIAELEQQETNLQNYVNDALDQDQIQPIVNELNIVRNKLSEKRYELQQLEEKEQQRAEGIEEKVSAEVVPFSMLKINLDGLPPVFIDLLEEVYRTTRKYTLNECAIDLEQVEEKLKECESVGLERGQEIDRLQAYANQRDEEAIELAKHYTSEVYRLTAELADAEQKRDAAVREKEQTEEGSRLLLSAANDELRILREKVSELEQAEEYRQRQEQPLTVSSEESTSLQAKADAVKKLFTHVNDWGSSLQVFKPDGSFELVKRKELESEWVSATTIPESEIAATDEVAFRPSLPNVPDAHTTNGLVGDTNVPESVQDHDGGAVTRDEFDKLSKEVMSRLYNLEIAVHGTDYVDTGDAA